MSRAEGIRKLGFRRWYERQLIEGHAYLVTCFLSMIMMAACVETFSLREPALQQLVMLGLLFGSGIVCIASWRRYHVVLVRAEQTGEQSTCTACRAYGRFEVLEPALPGQSGPRESAADVADMRLQVRCRKCGHQWTID